MVSQCGEYYTKTIASSIAKEKGIDSRVLESQEIGYNPLNTSLILPIFSYAGKQIQDVRIYKNKKFMSLSGGNSGIWGWKDIKRNDTVYICEGEWDRLALIAMLKVSRKKAAVVSVPGAGIFKDNWIKYFKDKDVNICYDNDKAGKTGAIKVFDLLTPVVRACNVLHWKKEEKEGKDVRDIYTSNKSKSAGLKTITQRLLPHPPEVAGVKRKKDGGYKKETIELTGPYVTIDEVYNTYREWLHLPNTDVLDVMFGTMIANRFEGDPLWLFIVAPPGGTKTELIRSLAKSPFTYNTSTLSSKSLISGSNITSQEHSLIPKLDGKVLVIKDFTTILDMEQMERNAIFGLLRDAYDGSIAKEFGTGSKSFVSKFGIITGVTPAIEVYTENATALGERFLKFNIPIPKDAINQLEYLVKAEANAGKEV